VGVEDQIRPGVHPIERGGQIPWNKTGPWDLCQRERCQTVLQTTVSAPAGAFQVNRPARW
jgi:hypothetical protein